MELNIRKDKKKKKKPIMESSTSTSLVPFYNVESHYEARIADLKENNKILSQALDSSYKTISLQDKTIAELQKKLSTQMPKLLRVKLQVIGKTLKDLLELWDDTFNLVSDETAMSNLMVEAQEQRPDGDIIVCNGTEKVSVGTQSHSGKKHKKKKEKSCTSLSSNTPSPQTFTSSNGGEVEEILREGHSKSSNHKDRSKTSSKKRKYEEMNSTAEQNIGLNNDNNEGVADGITIKKDHVKKSKKNSKAKSESSKKKVGKLSVKIKPLKKPKKKDGKKTSKKSWTVEYPQATIKVEPEDDEPVENPSLKIKIPGRTIYSSSSDSSDTSATETEIDVVSCTYNFPKGISPKVVLRDFMKEPEEDCDPIIFRYREKILNEITMQNVEEREEKIVPWQESEMFNGDNDPEQSVETSSSYEVQAPDSPDIDMFLSSSSKDNVVFVDDFCIGDSEHKTEGEDRILIEELY